MSQAGHLMGAVPGAATRAVQVKSKGRIVDKRRQPAWFSVIPASAMLGMLPLSINVTVSAKTTQLQPVFPCLPLSLLTLNLMDLPPLVIPWRSSNDMTDDEACVVIRHAPFFSNMVTGSDGTVSPAVGVSKAAHRVACRGLLPQPGSRLFNPEPWATAEFEAL